LKQKKRNQLTGTLSINVRVEISRLWLCLFH